LKLTISSDTRQSMKHFLAQSVPDYNREETILINTSSFYAGIDQNKLVVRRLNNHFYKTALMIGQRDDMRVVVYAFKGDNDVPLVKNSLGFIKVVGNGSLNVDNAQTLNKAVRSFRLGMSCVYPRRLAH